jgi:hypothetical protein
VDKESGYFLMEQAVTMIVPVTNGIWASDSTGVYFLAGCTMLSLSPDKKTDAPAITGTDAAVDLSLLPALEATGIGAVWMSEEGVFVGTADGTLFNMTEAKIASLPGAERGSGLVKHQRYIGVLQP